MSNIIYVNMQCQIIYSTCGVSILQDADEFNNLILQEKKRIAERDYILNRFEPWEVDNIKGLRTLLVSRCKNSNEKNLVMKYMDHLNKQEN
jgi:hypothetical protein